MPFTSRPRVLTFIAATFAVVLLGGTTYAVACDEPPTKTPQIQKATVTSPLHESSKAASSSAANTRPRVLVGSSELGRVVVLNGSTGKTTKVLFDARNSTDFCATLGGNVTMAPDQKATYFDLYSGTGSEHCEYVIKRVALTGGTAETVTSGASPKVSPDGTSLAFYRYSEGAEMEFGRGQLIVRDLATGTERVLRDHVQTRGTMNWSKDSKHIAAEIVPCPECASRVEIVDVASGSQSVVTTPASITAGGSVWGAPSFLPDGNLFVLETGAYGGSDGTKTAPRMLVVDPNTSAVVKVMATGFKDRWYPFTNSDSTGTHLLYTSYGKQTRLMVSDNGGRPVQLASGLTSADW